MTSATFPPQFFLSSEGYVRRDITWQNTKIYVISLEVWQKKLTNCSCDSDIFLFVCVCVRALPWCLLYVFSLSVSLSLCLSLSLSLSTAQPGPGPSHSWCFEITYNDTSQSVGLLWTSDRPLTDTSTWQRTTLKHTNIHASGGIRTRNSSKRSAVDTRLRPLGHWDQLLLCITCKYYVNQTLHQTETI